MRTSPIAALVACLLVGCVSAPPQNQPFSDVQDLGNLAGTYNNVGNPSGYLTTLLWPSARDFFLVGEAEVPHSAAKSIRVKVSGKVVLVEAIAHNCVIGSRTFTEGQEFQLSEGRILLRKETAVIHPGAGIGPSYDKLELGLDTKGDGKIRSTGAFVGLLLTMIPMAGYEQRDVRFARVTDAGVLSPCDR